MEYYGKMFNKANFIYHANAYKTKNVDNCKIYDHIVENRKVIVSLEPLFCGYTLLSKKMFVIERDLQ